PPVADHAGVVELVVGRQALLPLEQRGQEPAGDAVVARGGKHDQGVGQDVGGARAQRLAHGVGASGSASTLSGATSRAAARRRTVPQVADARCRARYRLLRSTPARRARSWKLSSDAVIAALSRSVSTRTGVPG